MTTRQSMPSRAEAHATACAWFPADHVTTPRARSSWVSDASLFSTPRGLNEPVFWNSSALRKARAPIRSPSVVEPNVGVRWTRPAIVSRAARTSSRVGRAATAIRLGERVLGARAAFGRREPAALRRDRAALDAVGRRHDDLHLACVFGPDLVDLGRAHARPQLGDLARHTGLDLDVVRRVVARLVPAQVDGRELVERQFAVGDRIALRAVGRDQLLVGVALAGDAAGREAPLRRGRRTGQAG